MTDFRKLRRALADLEGEIVGFGGRRGDRVLRLVHSLAFEAPIPDDDIVAALVGDHAAARVGRGPVMMPNAKGKSTAVLTAHGVALHKFEAQPFAFSTMLLQQNVEELAADPSVGAILIDYDTPGGHVVGTPEASNAIYNARQKKPIIGMVNSLAASAGYWLASQSSFLVSTSSGSTGSIGAFLLHLSVQKAMTQAGVEATIISNKQSPFKTEGNPFEPLSPDARDYEQKLIDQVGQQFINAVAAGRGVSAAEVEMKFGRGRLLTASDAKRVKMIDKIGSFESALAAAPSVAARSAAQDRREMLASFFGDQATRTRRQRLESLRR